MNITIDQLSLIIALLALISSIVFFIVNWQHSQRLFEQNVISEIDLRLEKNIWQIAQPLSISITNLGETSIKNVAVRFAMRRSDEKSEYGFTFQPFGIVAHESRSFSVEHMVYQGMRSFQFLKDNPDNDLGYEMLTELNEGDTDEKTIFLLVKLECTWESGVYKVNKKRTALKKYTFRPVITPKPEKWQIVEGWRGVPVTEQ